MDTELREKISSIQSDCWCDEGKHTPESSSCQECSNQITNLVQQEIAKARRSERLEVALDNYRGQTFSESTDYKSKFDKFVRNNEIRIEQLTLKENKEE